MYGILVRGHYKCQVLANSLTLARAPALGAKHGYTRSNWSLRQIEPARRRLEWYRCIHATGDKAWFALQQRYRHEPSQSSVLYGGAAIVSWPWHVSLWAARKWDQLSRSVRSSPRSSTREENCRFGVTVWGVVRVTAAFCLRLIACTAKAKAIKQWCSLRETK